ncbi:hypothetical protein SUGI_1023560 [Cryptomeria japonica]|uniref:anthocyanidin 3-O-glucosyltransferase 7 n=1 Tax=Cryptomeria japonica TaxID=3369 RepID=UPI0024148588|nr:anthocyanidin 3-O-glucosyltransferase 7 [Cryptomeria japonica]GLJ48501.1 hypothetical protein SUGI_1023560 [Cryptomeria japonica]
MNIGRQSIGHALLIPLPYQGHINPMMQLAWKLVSNGFLVTFLNTDFNHNRIMQAKTRNPIHNNWDGGIRMISIPDGLPPDDERTNIPNLLEALDNSMAPSVIMRLIEEINEREEEHKVSGIIVDAMTCFGLKEVADLYQIPIFAFHASLVANCALRYFIPRLISLGILGPNGAPKEDQKKIRYISSMPPLRSGDLPWLFGGEKMFKRCIRMGEGLKQIKMVLTNSFFELDGPVVEELSRDLEVYPIGPLIPGEFLEGAKRSTSKALPSFWANDVDCLEWLDKQSTQSVIYVSFGSLAVWSQSQVEEFAAGLEATQRPFLWVVRSDLIEGSKTIFPPGFLERVRNRSCIVFWAPQLEVLSHPCIACFVTHCGWNSVQESITMGVPMLCSPYFVDQFLNRTYIVDVWKIGLPLESNKDGIIEKAEIAKAVDRLLVGEDGAEIRKQVTKLMRTSRDTVKEGGSSFNNYRLFLQQMKKKLVD